MVLVRNLTVSVVPEQVIISSAAVYEVKCTGTFISIPRVTWVTATGKEVPALPGSVHQKLSPGSSTLIFENADISVGGEYECRATSGTDFFERRNATIVGKNFTYNENFQDLV